MKYLLIYGSSVKIITPLQWVLEVGAKTKRKG